jgi:kelch-like protein 10
MNTGEKYDPERRQWSAIKEMYNPRSNFGLEVIDDMIMAIGGFNGVVTISNCEAYVPEANEWLEATDMSIIRSALSATVMQNLPNIREYLHQKRHKLIEEKRIKMIANEQSAASFDFGLSDFENDSLSAESIRNIPFEAEGIREEDEDFIEEEEEEDDNDEGYEEIE